ncbi:CDP-glycerol glycerophosphotransferase family protein [Streptomyces sp. AM 4-1-1]|uniref:bifunctional glycosyltransferase/CDP-glycerol:glycerophosphate glycerophosphotransferase n=1 Tax=Streptomyces sp. AM 4-1-1 TaxID=3028710 RepID=UPI0023B9ACCD|nr:CDP-glycerol glycerophosphotransferase family protein [Streptomyces sp. AM 4-1-1]WEH33729.1 CDP-glycerol glycerophosphotransferase family protein [Streptomyces sp. AM 4-1-1]
MKPRLSVVVPVYNVEEHLEECLRSVAAQSVDDIEVVLVDDGSTDGSGAIARDFARRDTRFRYVRQPNAGLSAARNTGVRHTTPDVPYLAFVDSDDLVVHDAYERMLACLESTGSDLATGNVWRLDEQGRRQAWQYRWLTTSQARTHITRDPRLLADRVAWNKVFRRAFWDRHAFAFPEGKLYEDTPVMIPAHFLAGSVDVLREHVYYWRVREGSITRRRTDVRGVRDRIAACEQVSAFLADREDGQRRRYDLSCLRDDFGYFLEGLPLGGDAYRTAFMTDAGAFIDRMTAADPAVLDRASGLPAQLRLDWRLVRERRLDDLLTALAFRRTNGAGTFAVTGPPGRRRASYPGIPDCSVRLSRGDLPAVARLTGAHWGDDGKLRLRGYAYIRNLPATAPHHSLKAAMLRAAGGGRPRMVPVRTVPAPVATADSGQELHCYDHAGFELVVDPRKLRPGSRLVGLVVAGHGVVRRVAVRSTEAAALQPSVHDLGEGLRAVLGYRDGRLELTVSRPLAVVDAHQGGAELTLTGRLYGGARPTAVRFVPEGGASGPVTSTATSTATGAATGAADAATGPAGAGPVFPVECGADERFTVRVPLADLATVPVSPSQRLTPAEVEPEDTGRWRARLVLVDGTQPPLAAAPGLGLPAVADAAGELVIDLSGSATVDRAEWTPDGGLRVEGTGTADDLVLRHDTLRETVTVPVVVTVPGAGPVGTTGAGPGAGAGPVGAPGTGPVGATGAGAGPGHGAGAGAEAVTVPVPGPVRVPGVVPGVVTEPVAGVGPVAGAGAEAGGGDTLGRFTAVLSPALLAHTLRAGRWDAYQGGLPVRVRTSLTARLPLQLPGLTRPFTLDRRYGDRLTVHAGPALAVAERGAYRQAALRSAHHPAQRARPLRDAVLYTGGDSPRAVHAELVRRGTDVEHLWVVDERCAPGHVPPTATPVVEHSAAWYEALARVRRIVTADQLPEWFERRPGQTVVQTWHGTPLGRFGIDLMDTLYADHHHLASLAHRSAQWSFLVSPSTFATPVLRRALSYRGEVVEAGSPANDLLFSPDREKTAERVRRQVGVPDGRRVVLYAPTYRDQLCHSPSPDPRYRWDPALDLAALGRALGGTHTVLVRRHPRVAGGVPVGSGVLDVSGHPSAAELLLIADVLVTDYAGLVFDFAHTGRPMLFHTYDLEHYRDTVRGFCLDFESRAPGPLLPGTDEIVAALCGRDAPAERGAPHGWVGAGALRRVSSERARHPAPDANPGPAPAPAGTRLHAPTRPSRARGPVGGAEEASSGVYESFRRDFCDLDDGGAAGRVVDRLLAGSGG